MDPGAKKVIAGAAGAVASGVADAIEMVDAVETADVIEMVDAVKTADVIEMAIGAGAANRLVLGKIDRSHVDASARKNPKSSKFNSLTNPRLAP
jgi:hypothetical protein